MTILEDIADVYSGYSFRSSIENEKGGNFLILQAKNIKENGVLDCGSISNTSEGVRNPNLFLKKGDILMMSRGTNVDSFKTAVFKESTNNIFASSTVNIIRLKKPNLSLATYLSNLFNSNVMKKELFSLSIGGSLLKHLSISKLKKLEISLPNSQNIETINQLTENIQKQEDLLHQKLVLLKKVKSNIFAHYADSNKTK